MNRLDPLDALRVLAMMIVFTGHVIEGGPFPHITAGIGVWMFFALSGYQIGRGFKSGRYKAVPYLKKRFVTIGIPYLVFVLFLVVMRDPWMVLYNTEEVIRWLTFTNTRHSAYGWLWYISAIMQMYLIALLFGAALTKIKNNIYVCWTLFLLAVIGGCMLRMHMGPGPQAYFPVWMNLDLFFAPFLLSYLGINKRAPKALKAVILSAYIMMLAFMGTQTVRGVYYEPYLFTVVSVMTMLMIVAFDSNVREHNDKLSMAAIRGNPLRTVECLSVISFSFYLWHYVVIGAAVQWLRLEVNADPTTYVILGLVAFPVSCLMAVIWYFSIEKMSANIISGRKREA